MRNGWLAVALSVALAGVFCLSACQKKPIASTVPGTKAEQGSERAPESAGVGTGVQSEQETSTDCHLKGAGATFPEEFYKLCASKFPAKGKERITYKGIRSLEGIDRLQAGKIDFAGSDWPVPRAQAEWEMPSVVGAVSIVYNISGLTKPLRLTPEVLARIYMGKIKKWNETDIVVPYNRGAGLPNAEIITVRRAGGSGTTHIFTNFLTKLTKTWQGGNGFGFDKTMKWPSSSLEVDTNGQLADAVGATQNSIGYVEYSHAMAAGLREAWIQNKSGEFQQANVNTILAAVPEDVEDIQEDPEDVQQHFPVSRDKMAYPISGFTWIIANRARIGCEPLLSQFRDWVLSSCQEDAPDLGYPPLPPKVIRQYRKDEDEPNP